MGRWEIIISPSFVKHLALDRHLIEVVIIPTPSIFPTFNFSFSVVSSPLLTTGMQPHHITMPRRSWEPHRDFSSQLPGNPHLHWKKGVPFLSHQQNHTFAHLCFFLLGMCFLSPILRTRCWWHRHTYRAPGGPGTSEKEASLQQAFAALSPYSWPFWVTSGIVISSKNTGLLAFSKVFSSVLLSFVYALLGDLQNRSDQPRWGVRRRRRPRRVQQVAWRQAPGRGRERHSALSGVC